MSSWTNAPWVGIVQFFGEAGPGGHGAIIGSTGYLELFAYRVISRGSGALLAAPWSGWKRRCSRIRDFESRISVEKPESVIHNVCGAWGLSSKRRCQGAVLPWSRAAGSQGTVDEEPDAGAEPRGSEKVELRPPSC